MADDYRVNLKDASKQYDYGTPWASWMKGWRANYLRGEVNLPYHFYFDNNLLPITPSSWNYEGKNQNETLHMFNGNEVSWIKRSGLATWQFDFTISNPVSKAWDYEFKDGLRDPDKMIDYLKDVKDNKKTIQFVVTDGYLKNIVNEKVTLEDWSVEQDSENCNDYVFSVTLQEYKEWHNLEADIDLNHHLILAKYAKGWRT